MLPDPFTLMHQSHTHYFRATNFNINSPCLRGCNCAGVSLYPVCDEKGNVYYSPCHAGCPLNISAYSEAATDLQSMPSFDNCQCTQGASRVVSRENCREGECDRKVLIYFSLMALGGVVGGMGVVPGMLILLRSIPPKHRSLSLGFNGFLVSLLATLPSPIIWGALIDRFCIYKEHKCSSDVEGTGYCSLYATDQLRVWLHLVYGGIRLISMLTDLFVVYHAKDLRVTEEAEETGEKGEEDGTAGEKDDQVEEIRVGEVKKTEETPHVHYRRHRREASGGEMSPSARRKCSQEIEMWRKSSELLPGPISDI